MKNTPFTAEIAIDVQKVADTLTSALEGGIGYWATIDNQRGPDYHAAKCDQIARGHGFLWIIDRELDGSKAKRLKLDRAALARGVQLMAREYPRHFADINGDGGDATTGDVLVQLALLGEIVYG